MDGSEDEKARLLASSNVKKNGKQGSSVWFNLSFNEEIELNAKDSKKSETKPVIKYEEDQITDISGSKASKAFGSSISAREAWKESYKILKTLLGLLFANTTSTDKQLLAIGTIFAIIQGAMFTFVAVIFGSMTNSFIQHSIQGYANSSANTAYATKGLHNFSAGLMDFIDQPVSLIDSKAAGISEKLTGVFDLVNKIIFEAFTEGQALTKEEFTHYVSITGQLFLLLALVASISAFFQVLCWECVASNQKFQLRESVIMKILKQDMTWFESHDIGEMMSNVFGEVGFVREALGFTFCSVIENLVMFMCTSVVALAINWRLALVFLGPTPFRIFQSLFLAEKISDSSEASKLWHEAEDCSSEALANVDTVIAFGEQRNYVNKFGSKLEESIDNQFEKCHLSAIGQGVLQILIYGVYGLAFWYSCRLLMQGAIKPGEICTIFLAVTMGTLAMSKIFNSISVFGTAFGSAKNLKDYAEPPSNIDCLGESGDKMGPTTPGKIEFEKVSFGYNSEKKVLHDLKFKIEAGKTVAILAECGEGKTTIANLLIRLYDANEGEIKLDGKLLKNINVKNLRKHIAIALQDSLVNSDQGVIANVKAGRTVPLEEIQKVKAIIDPLKKFPVNEDCYVPAELKGMVNLARSIIDDPSVLILDEAFIELPFEAKHQIRKNLLDYRKGKTTILLTSDILSLEDMDLIYVLKDGQILEQNIGTHAELMTRENSIYKTMHDSALAIQEFMNQMSGAVDGHIRQAGGHQPGDEIPQGYLALYDINSTIKMMWALGLVGCLIGGLRLVVFSFYFVEIFGTFSKSGEELSDDGIFWAGMLLVLAFFSGLGVWLRDLFMRAAALYFVLTIRTTAFGSILRRSRLIYDTHKTTPSSLGAKAISNTPYIRHAFELQLPEEISTIITLFDIWILISFLIWQIGIIDIFVVVPILIFLAAYQFLYQKKGREISSQYDDDAARLLANAVEVITLVQAYSMQEFYIRNYRQKANQAIREAHKQSFVFAFLFACCQALLFSFFGVSFLYGSYLITNAAIMPENLFKVFFAVAFCIMTFNQTVSLMPDLAKATASLEEINDMIRQEYLGYSDEDALNEEGEQVGKLNGKIEFVFVGFKYANGHEVFKYLKMTIEAGSTVAITGPSAFGGTTLLYLILRFYDPKPGHVMLDDSKYLKMQNLRQVREQIGWIPQKLSFFQGSLADNLKYGCTKPVTQAQLFTVLQTVQLLDEFENDLELYEDDLYWNSLSKVKRVLIAIARAIIRDPKILLIDSPTTSMSLEDQMKVTEVIKKVKENRTCIIISRIPYTISIADRIIVINNGTVIEEGKLEELLQQQDGYYSNWVKTAAC